MKGLLLFATTMGAIAVILGAFAAHKLKFTLTDKLYQAFTTGVDYQFYHVLAILLTLLLSKVLLLPELVYSAALFAIGIILFSGSLYGLALTGYKFFGPITPLGGLCFIAGWLLLTYQLIKIV